MRAPAMTALTELPPWFGLETFEEVPNPQGHQLRQQYNLAAITMSRTWRPLRETDQADDLQVGDFVLNRQSP